MQEIRGRDCPFKNASGERIPPGALLVPGATIEDTGAVRVTKPTAANMPGLLVNGPFTVDVDGEGVGTFGPAVELGYDAAGLTADVPAAGTYGSQAGSWYAKAGNFGFVAFGTAGADYGLMNAVRDGTGSPASSPPPPPGFPSWCGWLAELVNWSAVVMEVVSASGQCECVELGQKMFLVKTGTAGEWVPITGSEYPTQFVACTDNFTVKFINIGCGPPCLELTSTPSSGAGTTTRLFFDGCDETTKTVYFRGSGPRFCDGDPTPCVGDDTFRVKLSCGVICQCDGTYPIPARLHVTFVGGDFTDCIADGQSYALDYTGTIAPGGEQWEYRSNAGTGCGPFTGYVPFFPYGITVTAVGCFNGPYAVGIVLQGPWDGTEAPAVEFQSQVGGDRTVQCNPLVIEFTELEVNYLGAGAAALFATIGTTLPTKIVITA